MNARSALKTAEGSSHTRVAIYLSNLFAQHGQREEHFYTMFLDRGRRFLGERFVRGVGVAGIQMRAREILADALQVQAHGIVIAHNHPSGFCRPSEHDYLATRRLSHIAATLDIELLDHLIITRNRAYSMRAREEI